MLVGLVKAAKHPGMMKQRVFCEIRSPWIIRIGPKYDTGVFLDVRPRRINRKDDRM